MLPNPFYGMMTFSLANWQNRDRRCGRNSDFAQRVMLAYERGG
jgi:hypothetical protein